MSTPIPIVGVDVDAVARVEIDGVAAGQRIRLEFARGGQVVGVVEVPAEEGGVSEATLRASIDGLAPVTSLAYEILDDGALPFISVVVPTTCATPARLQEVVDGLVNLNYPHFEVIIVDNRSDPHREPLPFFAGGDRVRSFWEPLRGASAARNLGIAKSVGEVIAFTDDDVAVDARWLRELGTRFVLSPEVEAVSGLTLPMELRTEPQLWFEEFFGGFNTSLSGELLNLDLLADDPLFPYATGRFGASCNLAFRSSTLHRIGGFDVRLGAGAPSHGAEDIDLSMRLVLAHGTFAFEPRAIVRHQHRDSSEAFFSQVFGYGTGLTAMFTKLIVHDPRHLFKMARRFLRGLQLLFKPRDERSPSAYASFPRKTYAFHFLGMAYGPFAYLRSVAKYRGKG
jgi:GT2 family glycosyltransferase